MINKGTCRYCGQVRLLEDSYDPKEADEEATLMCDCPGAKNYKKKQEQIEKAKDNIDLAFYQNHPEAAELLKQSVELIANYKISKVTVDTGKKVKGTVSLTTKGTIKVDFTKTEKVVYDE